MGEKLDRKSQVYWDRTAMPPSLHETHLSLLSLDLFTPTFSRDQSHVSHCPLAKIDTKISSLWGLLHEGPDRLAQWVSQGWLATADTWEGAGKWVRTFPEFDENLTKSLSNFSASRCIFSSWDIFLLYTDVVCPVVEGITWMKHLLSADLELQRFLQTVLSLFRRDRQSVTISYAAPHSHTRTLNSPFISSQIGSFSLNMTWRDL